MLDESDDDSQYIKKLEAALREALKLVNGDNTRKASDVLREQWERLLGVK